MYASAFFIEYFFYVDNNNISRNFFGKVNGIFVLVVSSKWLYNEK